MKLITPDRVVAGIVLTLFAGILFMFLDVSLGAWHVVKWTDGHGEYYDVTFCHRWSYCDKPYSHYETPDRAWELYRDLTTKKNPQIEEFVN